MTRSFRPSKNYFEPHRPPATVPVILALLLAAGLSIVATLVNGADLSARRGSSLWIDLEADAAELSTPEAIQAVVDSAAAANLKRIIVDVKRRNGAVLFKSRRARQHVQDFPVFETFRKAADRHGLELVAHYDVFPGGDTQTGVGPGYDHPEWQTIINVEGDGLMPQGEYSGKGPVLFLNPALSEVQRYQATVISDLLGELKPDALLLDEFRFFAKAADYSDSTQIQFLRSTNMTPEEWPKSVENPQNPRYPNWMTYRVGVIYEFIMRIQKLRDTVAPETPLYLAVPGYYEPATDLGVNWGHSSFSPRLWWTNQKFRDRSLADRADQMIILSRETNPTAVKEVLRGAGTATQKKLPLSILVNASRFPRRPARFRECLQVIRAEGHDVAITGLKGIQRDKLWEIIGDEVK